MAGSKKDVVPDGGAYHSDWERPTAFYNKYVKYGIYGALLLFVLWSLVSVVPSLARFTQGFWIAVDIFADFLRPDFGPDNRSEMAGPLLESLAMAVVATIAGVVISIPIGFMAAENLMPRPVYYLNRGFITVSRAFHELIVAIIMVKAVGIGPLAGVLALVFKTVGFFSKLLAEDIEDMDEGPLEAIRATGATPTIQYTYGVLPQVMPRIIGLTVYRWDINIRQSTIVGIVGAGGIGITLLNAFDRYQFDFVSAMLLVIIAIVLIGEGISLYVRRRVQ